MVTPIAPVAATAASAPTRTESSFAISEPEVAWVDARQSHINADLAALKERHEQEPGHEEGEEKPEENSLDDRHPHRRQHVFATDEDHGDKGHGDKDAARLSGESERIGTRNYDENTPFGHRSIIV